MENDIWAEIEIKIHEKLEKMGVDTSNLDLVECLDKISSNNLQDIYYCRYKDKRIYVIFDKDRAGNWINYTINIQ